MKKPTYYFEIIINKNKKKKMFGGARFAASVNNKDLTEEEKE